ncbi:hypothetical protein DIPPA_07478 [Diplonema papillatum]|nr:hypothetical protein DIPPA_07478 [Diplonema papillatum]
MAGTERAERSDGRVLAEWEGRRAELSAAADALEADEAVLLEKLKAHQRAMLLDLQAARPPDASQNQTYLAAQAEYVRLTSEKSRVADELRRVQDAAPAGRGEGRRAVVFTPARISHQPRPLFVEEDRHQAMLRRIEDAAAPVADASLRSLHARLAAAQAPPRRQLLWGSFLAYYDSLDICGLDVGHKKVAAMISRPDPGASDVLSFEDFAVIMLHFHTRL